MATGDAASSAATLGQALHRRWQRRDPHPSFTRRRSRSTNTSLRQAQRPDGARQPHREPVLTPVAARPTACVGRWQAEVVALRAAAV